jgi:hypothetical protein
MTRFRLRHTALRWPVGSALLLLALAGPTMASLAKISGTVKVPDNYSLDQATVTASDANNHLFRVKVADDGTYTLDGVAAGTYTLTVQAKGSETPPVQNVVLTDGQTLKQDFTLTAAKPVCFVKSAAPIPLEDDINSASFADVPDIRVDSVANLVEPVFDKADGNLPVLNQWGGPATVGGRFRLKYSSVGIHLAADLTLKVVGVNLATPNHNWQGNSIEFDFQNDPYDPERSNYDPDHNWQLIVGLGETPTWYLYGALNSVPSTAPLSNDPVKEEPISNHLRVKPRPNNDGQLVRIDIPWAIYQASDKKTLITPPKDGDLGAAEIAIDYNNPASTKEKTVDPLYQITWSGLDTGYGEGNSLKPIQFCAQAP